MSDAPARLPAELADACGCHVPRPLPIRLLLRTLLGGLLLGKACRVKGGTCSRALPRWFA